jgi:antitoxin component YwqK of YwqJK toxin-antitoxin module
MKGGLIISMLCWIAVHALKAQPQFTQYRYENGMLSSEGTLRDGKPDGYWKTYYPSGQLKTEGNRKNFLLDSTWNFYSEKGIIQKSISYFIFLLIK